MTLDESSSLSVKEEALSGVAASIAAGCRPCTHKWLHAARAAGACERGIGLAVETALAARATATREMADFAAALLAGSPEVDEAFRSERARLVEVFACSAALAVNNTDDLGRRIAMGRALGATSTQLGAAIAIARAVGDGARSEALKVVTREELDGPPKLSGKWCCEALSGRDLAPKAGCGCEGERM